MPELAEVEFYRKQWHAGVGGPILNVALHPEKRIFRKVDPGQLQALLPGSVLTHSEARGKQLLFGFSGDVWLGLHLGMTGKLGVLPPDIRAGKHDHLVLFQHERALVFSDPRLFGCVQFHVGKELPGWWTKAPPDVSSPRFVLESVSTFLRRHGRLPIKAALLLQAGFPGIGNWMADEILWRARIHPLLRAGTLSEAQQRALWRSLRFVCRGALRTVGENFSDPPRRWLFHQRWNGSGRCPVHETALQRASIGGRTTAWCPSCQSLP